LDGDGFEQCGTYKEVFKVGGKKKYQSESMIVSQLRYDEIVNEQRLEKMLKMNGRAMLEDRMRAKSASLRTEIIHSPRYHYKFKSSCLSFEFRFYNSKLNEVVFQRTSCVI
jgi:hypothetical protein